MNFAKLYQLEPELQVLVQLDMEETARCKYKVVQTAYYAGTLATVCLRFFKEENAIKSFNSHTKADALKFMQWVKESSTPTENKLIS